MTIMRFFVPSANDPNHGENIYSRIRERVEAFAGPVSDKRIYNLKFHRDGKRCAVTVGSDYKEEQDSPVFAIFEAPEGGYYICTRNRGAFDGEPYRIPADVNILAETFTALR